MLKTSKFLTIVFGCGILFSAFVETITAQDLGVRVPIKNVARTTAPTGSRKPPPPRPQVKIQKVTVVQQVVKRETQVVNVKTSNLVVSSESGAKVSLKSAVSGVKPMTKNVSKNNPEDKTVEFENLKPGKYVVTASLDGYKTQETDVMIAPQKTIGISLELEPYLYKLSIDTNIEEGEVRFAPARLEGTNTDGSLKTTETAGYCIVRIKNKKAVINDLQQGYYNIDIRPTAVEYQPILTAINVPTEIPDEKNQESDEAQSYSIDLEKKISTNTFASAWVNEDWVLPNGWKLQDRRMKTSGSAGIALPRSEQYRYYTNFEMISDVKLPDSKSIGFALRAFDQQNYYLVQLSGAKAAEPFVLSGFVVKNGTPKLLISIPIENVASILKNSKGFRVIIRGDGNAFNVFVVDSNNGDEKPLGKIIDRDNEFRKGAVGIAGVDNSNSEIGSFTVCANICR